MFYGVTLMLIVVIMLLVLDHKSLYTRFFVVMFLGVTIAFFFMIQQLSIFAAVLRYTHPEDLPVHPNQLQYDLREQ